MTYAKNWDISKPLRDKIKLKDIEKNFNDIHNAEELQNFILYLSQNYPFTSLEARKFHRKWLIQGKITSYIRDVSVTLMTKKAAKSITEITQTFKGRVHSEESIQLLNKKVINKLKMHGYFLAKVNIKSENRSDGAYYSIDIDEGKQCEISKIQLNFSPPDNIKLNIDKGDYCNYFEIKKKLNDFEYELLTSGYKDVSINFKDLQLNQAKDQATLRIHGKIGRRLVFKIEDNENLFYVDSIFNNIELNRKYSTISNPDLLIFELKKLYRSRGYDDVEVAAPKRIPSDPNTDAFLITIKPGKQYFIENIRFSGNLYLENDRLQPIFSSESFWGGGTVLNREQLSVNLNTLKNLYIKQGFWDVKIHNPRITKNRTTGSANITISIREGKKRVLNKIKIKGNTYFSYAEIKSLYDPEGTNQLNRSLILSMEEKIYQLYKQEGFNYIKISIKLKSTKERRHYPTDLIISIQEGPQVKIGKIFIVGLIKTHKDVIKRELMFETGDLYNPDIIARSRKAIMDLGIFRSVQIIPTNRVANLNQSKIINLNVEVSEAQSGNVTFGPGYNFQKGIRFISELSLNNLYGTGRKVSLRASLSQEKNQQPINDDHHDSGDSLLGRKVSVGYVEPYILGIPVDGLFSLTHVGIADEIWKLSNNINLSLNHKIKYFLEGALLSTYYNYKLNREYGSSLYDSTLISTGNSVIGSVGLKFSWDLRNDISWPTSGNYTNIHTSWAKYEYGGDTNYFKWDLTFRQFNRLSKFVFANSINLASYQDISRKNNLYLGTLPYSERLQAGGVTKVRGFIHDLGPYIMTLDNQNAQEKATIGGTHKFIIKSEVRYKFNSYLASSVFIDNGNSFFSDAELDELRENYAEVLTENTPTILDNHYYKFQDLAKYPQYLLSRNYTSTGISLSFISPVGPINAFVSWPLKEPVSEECEQDSTKCFKRGKQNKHFYENFKFDINIGTEF